METNTHFVRGFFKIEVPKEYEMDEDLEITLKGSVVKVERKSNQDGTCDYIAVFKASEGSVAKVPSYTK